VDVPDDAEDVLVFEMFDGFGKVVRGIPRVGVNDEKYVAGCFFAPVEAWAHAPVSWFVVYAIVSNKWVLA